MGAQYFRTRDWSQVLKPESDRGHGWSAWASVQVAPKVTLFARHDAVKSSVVLDPLRQDRYSNVGVEWRARPWLHLAAVWKRARLDDGLRHLRVDNEAGIWAQINY